MGPSSRDGDFDRDTERRVLRLVAAAQELPVEQRSAFVSRECGPEPEVYKTVTELLASCDQFEAGDDFLQQPAVAFSEPLIDAVQRGDALASDDAAALVADALRGRYDMGRVVGRGGGAIVYQARDVRHNRDVAIKVVTRESTSATQRQRFLREVEISARLQHSYIVPLIDSGETAGTLYYVMPYLEGESLRHRIDREGALPLPDVVALTDETAEALDFAHVNGIVHRDIKPSNILLQGAHAVVADFGIALTLPASTEGRLTGSGVVIGTPHYMSPEQASGSQRVDGRSDVYSLACVVYEMLTGEVPFTGASAQAIRANHLDAPVPQLALVRPTLPPPMQQVLERALAKSQADRFPTAGEFARSLRAASVTSTPVDSHVVGQQPAVRNTRRRKLVVQGVAGVFGIAALLLVTMWWQNRPIAAPAPDADTIVLFSLERRGLVPDQLNEMTRLRSAFLEWKGLPVVDPFRLSEALDGKNGANIDLSASHRIASSLGAGRFLRGSVVGDEQEVRVQVMMYDVSTGRMVAEESERVPAALPGVDSVFAKLVEGVLFRNAVPDAVRLEKRNTWSYAAYRHFLLGQGALTRWNLAEAESQFELATEADGEYSEGWLWLGLTRRWDRQALPRWQVASRQASRGLGRFGPRDSVLDRALQSFAVKDVAAACSTLEASLKRFPTDYSVWYASADCLDRDLQVVRYAQSPTGWRFRSSFHAALERYRRAFELMPSIHLGLRRDGFEPARRIFQTSRSILRRGVAASPDSFFYASPSLQGDSLVFVPVPAVEFSRSNSALLRQLDPGIRAAVQRQRGVFRDIASGWVAAAPRSSEAYEALGIALQLLGDPSALDTLARARQLATTPAARANAAVSAVLVALRLGAPDDPGILRSAKLLADSLLADTTRSGMDTRSLATLAALTGRAFKASEFARRIPASIADDGLTPELRDLSTRLTIYAAMGGPIDSLAFLEKRVESLLVSTLSSDKTDLRLGLFGRSAVLALPGYRFAAFQSLPAGVDNLLDATRAGFRGDTASAHKILAEARASRAFLDPEDLTFDTLLPEAVLLEQMGAFEDAAEWLGAPLLAQRRTSNGYADPILAGSLVRAMALRADLAERLGDREESRRWARCVVELWSSADVFLQPIVERMRRMLSSF